MRQRSQRSRGNGGGLTTTGNSTTSTASPQEQSVSRSKFKEEFAAAATGEGSPFTEEQASCRGDKIYDEVGADRITELHDKLVDSGNIPSRSWLRVRQRPNSGRFFCAAQVRGNRDSSGSSRAISTA